MLGEDPGAAGRDWRERIGIVLQQCRIDPYLTVRETLELYAGYYRAPRPVDETIELVGLGDKADARAGKLSGGQQRRLDVGVALIGDPELLFLDEPTTGFDPSARRQAWEVIAGLRDLGKTVFLTTHYMDEAQRLADRVAIIAARPRSSPRARPRSSATATRRPTTITLPAAGGARGLRRRDRRRPVAETLNELTGWALARGVELEGLEVSRPSLEDVYLELTGDGDGDERRALVLHQFRYDQKVFWRNPAVGLLHRGVPGDLPAHLRADLRRRDGRRARRDRDHDLLRAGDPHAGDRLGDDADPRDDAHDRARERAPEARPRHAAAAPGSSSPAGSATRSSSRC